MSDLSPSLMAAVTAACKANAAGAAAALTNALGSQITLGEPEPTSLANAASQPGWDGPGLVALLMFGKSGLAIAIPESSGILPDWYGAPDATGQSKLNALTQELGELFVPGTLKADGCEARRVASMAQSLARSGVAPDAAVIALGIQSSAGDGQVTLVWPLGSPAAAFDDPQQSAAQANQAAPALTQLPPYSRSLLRIKIPISVHLASKKESVEEIVALVPGAIIKFDKGCDELLEMVVGGQNVAAGEAVKVGDKFGFRITNMLLPREHFVPARRPAIA